MAVALGGASRAVSARKFGKDAQAARSSSAIYHPRGQKLHLARRAEVDTELEMSGGEAASEDLRALLVTHNVCGVFDQMESALPFWVQELQALVREQSADFVALHMQEFT